MAVLGAATANEPKRNWKGTRQLDHCICRIAKNGKCRGNSRDPVYPGVSSLFLCQSNHASSLFFMCGDILLSGA